MEGLLRVDYQRLNRASIPWGLIELALVAGNVRPPGRWHEHTDVSAIRLIRLPVAIDQVPLLKLDGDEDVKRGDGREQKMSGRHRGCSPKGDYESKHDR